MPEPWLLQLAGPSDLDAIMALETATFPDDAWSREGMLAELTGPHRHYLVARRPGTADSVLGGGAGTGMGDGEPGDGGAIDGYAGLLAPMGTGQGDIQTIAVAPASRRGGLGRMLMLALIAEARRRGVVELFLEVRADNPGAQRLYEQLGFESIAVRPRYYQPAGVDAIVMRLAVPTARTEQTQPEQTAAPTSPAPTEGAP